MIFEPTFDYSQTDLNKEENQILWKFGELIKALITIASDANKQKDIIGMGAVADEMAIDFETYFTLSYNQYLNHQLLSKKVFDELIQLDEIFDSYSGDKNPDFWDDNLLEINKDWEIARQKAKYILSLMDMDNLDIECVHHDIISKNIIGKKKIVGQQTLTLLVNKKA